MHHSASTASQPTRQIVISFFLIFFPAAQEYSNIPLQNMATLTGLLPRGVFITPGSRFNG